MNSFIERERRGRLAVLRLRNGPVNALSAAVRIELFDALQALDANPEIQGVIVLGAGRCFSAGADIKEFTSPDGGAMFDGRDPADITALIDRMHKPVLAALHGLAFGGGLELALGCHHRVALPDTQLGLPEIQLGLLPGAGGTQRLPRLIGPAAACGFILSGDPVSAGESFEMGMVDALACGDLLEAAVAHLQSVLEKGRPLRRTRDLMPASSDVPADYWTRVRAQAESIPALSFAARRIVDCVEAALRLPFDKGMHFEREQFQACNASPAAAALQHMFFAQRAAAKVSHIPSGTEERPVSRVAVVGAGTMGRGIAMAFANAGYPVTLLDSDAQRADAAAQAVVAEYRRMAVSDRITPAAEQERSARVTAATGDEALRTCDLVIEAVFEDLEIKREVCRRLGQVCRSGAIIASNTSTLDINALATASGRPTDFIGLHFFSPAHVMRLVEVVRGDCTGGEVLATAIAIARRLGKHPVVSGVCWGFIGNRMLEPYLREAEALLLEGATPSRVDRALEDFGMAMGPFRMLDLAGVDVAAKVVIEREKQGALPADPLYRIVVRELNSRCLFGQKTGEGFYRYEGRRAVDDSNAVQTIRGLAQHHGLALRTDISDTEIVERCLFPLMNEGFKILEEGIAYRSSDIDVVWVSGYGFPVERGGPLFHAARIGLDRVRERLSSYGRLTGDPHGYWAPARLLNEPPSGT